MQITIISDCSDDNARVRQMARVGSLIPNASVSYAGVGSYADLAAAGNLIDVLDGYEGREGVVLVNVAPRHKAAKKWPNGTPFGYFWYEKSLVVASIDGLTLSLVKKLTLANHINVLDIPTNATEMRKAGFISESVEEHLQSTQFRSFDFVPRVAAFLVQGGTLSSEKYSLSEVPDAPRAVWWIDNFGNAKTTILPHEVDFAPEKSLSLFGQTLTCYSRLKDVPDGEKAVIVGSSGLCDERFLEVVVQGERAEESLNLSIGSKA